VFSSCLGYYLCHKVEFRVKIIKSKLEKK